MATYKNSDEIYEQFVDAATALIMNQYAVAMEENLRAEPEPTPQEVPEALDHRCRRLIRKQIGRSQRRSAGKRILKFARNAALIAILLCSIAVVLYTSVDAIRIPIANFFIQQRNDHTEFGAQDIQDDSVTLLTGLVPEYYELVQNYEATTGDVFIMYKTLNGDRIELSIMPPGGFLSIDSENAENVESLTIGSCKALMVVKDAVQIVWMDEETGLIYHIFATALSREEVIALAESIGTPKLP